MARMACSAAAQMTMSPGLRVCAYEMPVDVEEFLPSSGRRATARSRPERTLGARDRTVLSRFWLEFGVLACLQHDEISRRFGLNIFYTGQFDGYNGSASIT